MTKLERLGRELDFNGKADRQRRTRLIQIDTHEDLDRLTELLLVGMGYTVERRTLPLGDYQWDSRLGRCIVERKTPTDARDIKRLRRQAGKLRASVGRDTPSRPRATFPIILIDHRNKKDWKPWDDHDFDNLLISLSGRIRIAHCLQGFLAYRLDSLYRWSNKSSHGLLDTGV